MNILQKEIVRTNRNLIITMAVLFVVFGILIISTMDYLKSSKNGPQVITPEEAVSGEAEGYVEIEGIDVYDTGLYYYEGDEFDENDILTNYLYLVMDESLHILIVALPHDDFSDDLPLNYSGELVSMPSDVRSEITSGLINDGFSQEEIDEMMLPYMLDAKEYTSSVPVVIFLLGGLLVAILICLLVVIKRVMNQDRHPLYKNIALYGDLNYLQSKIESECAQQEPEDLKNIIIGKNWIIIKRMYKSIFVLNTDILWVYKGIVQHRYNFIPTGKSYELWIYSGKTGHRVRMSERKVETAMEAIYHLAPWAIFGYKDEIKKEYDRNKTSFINTIEARKQNFSDMM